MLKKAGLAIGGFWLFLIFPLMILSGLYFNEIPQPIPWSSKHQEDIQQGLFFAFLGYGLPFVAIGLLVIHLILKKR